MDTPKSSIPKFAVAAAVLFPVLLSCLTWGGLRYWHPHGFQSLLQKTYCKNGIQFSYYRDWQVVERAAPETTDRITSIKEHKNGYRITRTIQTYAPTINIEGPHGATVTFALFEPSYSESLNVYADRMRTMFAADLKDDMVENGPVEPVVGRIQGTNYNGFRYHFTVRPSMSPLTARYRYFFELRRTRTNKIMLSLQLPEQFVDGPEVQLILDSIALEGEINPVGPIDYHLVNFENLEESLKAGSSIAQHSSGEDLAVVKAWNQTLADYITARQTLDKAANDFESADILNVHTIIKTGNPKTFGDQFIERRRIANAYWAALQDWKTRLSLLRKTYEHQLHAFNVSEGRCSCELDRLAEGTDDSLPRLQAACGADQVVALQCNNAVGSMEVFSATHNVDGFKRELTKVDALKLKAAELHGQRPPPITSSPADSATNRNGAVATAPPGKKVGMILYQPDDAVAMIGNHTVRTGDVVDGFKIIAIEKDSVTVQSTAGVKTALRLGDVLK
jgi:hypothetical protein